MKRRRALKIALVVSRSTDLVPLLEQGQLDIGLVIDDVLKHPRLQVEAMGAEPLALLVHPGHALLTRSAISAEDLRDQAFLLTDPGCAYRSKLEHALGKEHVRPRAVMELTSVETIKHCAALGMGIACLPAIVADSEIVAGKLAALPWSRSNLTMKTLVAWHEDKWRSPGMEEFLSLLRTRFKPKKSVALKAVAESLGVPNKTWSGPIQVYPAACSCQC